MQFIHTNIYINTYIANLAIHTHVSNRDVHACESECECICKCTHTRVCEIIALCCYYCYYIFWQTFILDFSMQYILLVCCAYNVG